MASVRIPIFNSGKYKGRTYEDVFRTAPGYIFKIMDRQGPMYTRELEWFENRQKSIQNRRLSIKATKGEKAARNSLKEIDSMFIYEFHLEALPKKRYDFKFIHESLPYILEIDGSQHFIFPSKFHRTQAKFRKYQKTDVLKTHIAIINGYRVIRIDYTQICNLDFHLTTALSKRSWLYLSNVEKYKYLTENLP